MSYFKAQPNKNNVIIRKKNFFGDAQKQPFFSPIPPNNMEQGISDNTTAQMLMDIESFRTQSTSKSSRTRSAIINIDTLLEQYNKIGGQPNDFIKRKTALTNLQQACLAYLGHKSATDDPADAAGGRVVGVKALMTEIDLEMPVLNLCVEAFTTIGNDTKLSFKKGMDAREKFSSLQENNPQMPYNNGNYKNIDIDRLFDLIIQQMNMDKNRDTQMKELIAEDIEQLKSIAQNGQTPILLKNILLEALSYKEKIHFQETGGMSSGAVLSGEKDREKGIDKKYRLDMQLNQQSNAIRQSSLLHEMTHIATQEAFENTVLHLAYKKGESDEYILGLSQHRTKQVNELLAILGEAKNAGYISAAQYTILEEKTSYPVAGKNTLGSYVHTFKSKIGAQETEHLLYLEQQGANNTLIEFDTVMNQMYFMITQWGISPDTAFYKKLAAIVEEAYQRRAENQLVDL